MPQLGTLGAAAARGIELGDEVDEQRPIGQLVAGRPAPLHEARRHRPRQPAQDLGDRLRVGDVAVRDLAQVRVGERREVVRERHVVEADGQLRRVRRPEPHAERPERARLAVRGDPVRRELAVPGRRQQALEQLGAGVLVDEVDRVPVALALAPRQPVGGVGPEGALDPGVEALGAVGHVHDALADERDRDHERRVRGAGDEGGRGLLEEPRQRRVGRQRLRQPRLDARVLLARVGDGDDGLDLAVGRRRHHRVGDRREHLGPELADVGRQRAFLLLGPLAEDLRDPGVDAGLAEHPLDVLADGLDEPLGQPRGLGEVRLLPGLEDLVLVAEHEGPGDGVGGRVREGQVHAQRPHDVLGQLLDVHAGGEPLDDAGRLVDERLVGRALAPLVEAAEGRVQPGPKRAAGGPELDRGALGVGEVGAPGGVDLRLLGLADLPDGARVDLWLAAAEQAALVDDHLLRGRELDDRSALALLRADQLARRPARGGLAAGVHRADEVEVRGVRRAPDERDPLGAVVAQRTPRARRPWPRPRTGCPGRRRPSSSRG